MNVPDYTKTDVISSKKGLSLTVREGLLHPMVLMRSNVCKERA